MGEIGSDDYAVTHPFTRIAPAGELGHRQRDFGARQCPVGQVRQDAQEDLALGELLDQRGNAFAHAIDEVRPHRVPGVDQQVHHSIIMFTE